MNESPSWGIEPVPDRLRVLGTLDSFLLWTNLGISLLVLVSSAYFGLSLKQALLATLVGGAARQPRCSASRRRSAPTRACRRWRCSARRSASAARYLATGLNVLQCLGWSVFEITVIAIAAGCALRPRSSACTSSGCGSSCSARSGSCSRCSGRSASCAASCARSGSGRSPRRSSISRCGSSRNGHVGRLWHEGGHGGSFWLGVDLVIALTVSWVPLVADYTRFSRDRRSAFVGAGPRLPAARRSSSSASARSSCSRIRRSAARPTCSRPSPRAASARSSRCSR